MSLLRSIEKTSKHGLDICEDELNRVLRLLISMRDVFIRRDLLQGDTDKLDALCRHPSNHISASNMSDDMTNPFGSNEGGKNKRKRRKQGSSVAVQYQVQLSAATETSVGDSVDLLLNASSSCDEILIMTFISRVLNTSPSMMTQNFGDGFSSYILIRATGDLLTCINCYTQVSDGWVETSIAIEPSSLLQNS